MIFLLKLVIASLLMVCLTRSHPIDHIGDDFPAPNTKFNRVLGMLLSFNLGHMDPLSMIIDEYLSMCEAGWEPTVAIFTADPWKPILRRYLRRRSYCYRIGRPIEIRYLVYDPSIGIALGAEHRKYTGREIYNYDVFVYHEDDILFKYAHLVAYLNETKVLHEQDPKWGLNNHCIGFQRYRHIAGSAGHSWNDIIEQNLLEEMPVLTPICFQNQDSFLPYLSVTGNTHQAMWILTKNQILAFQAKCGFLNYSSPSREHMSSFGLFGHCQVAKLIPARSFTTFTVLHYYQQRHVSWTPVFTAIENMETGYHYYANPKVKINLPSCWKNISLTAVSDISHDNDNVTEPLLKANQWA
jgi:hypothetical protein